MGPLLHPDASVRSAVEGAIRAELDALGDRLGTFRTAANAEIERLAALRWVTELAGIGGTEVAERAGVSRQTLANLRSGDRAADHEWPVDLRVMLELGLSGPKSSHELMAAIGLPPVHGVQVTGAIERLKDEGLIAVAGRAAGEVGEPIAYWRLTGAGTADLPQRLRQAAIPPSRSWTAYVRSTAAEATAIAGAGGRALGDHGVLVIPAGTVSGMEQPEVAFQVEAHDPKSAEMAAAALFAELRERAGMTPRGRPVVVSALVPPARQRSR